MIGGEDALGVANCDGESAVIVHAAVRCMARDSVVLDVRLWIEHLQRFEGVETR
jgi:hypothetical protein